MVRASMPSSRTMASAASTMASRLRAGLAGRARRLRGDASELMASFYRLTRTMFVTYSVRHEHRSSHFIDHPPGVRRVPTTPVATPSDLDLATDDAAAPPAYRWR